MRRAVTWLVLAAYVVLAAGLPLPAGMAFDPGRPVGAAGAAAAKDRSRPFPCMNSPCGCATAEQCFSRCCCHSVAERLAWAHRNGVDAEMLAALARGSETPPRAAAPRLAAGCCSVAGTPEKPVARAVRSDDASCCRRTAVDDAGPVREASCTRSHEAHVTTHGDGRGLRVAASPSEGALPGVVTAEAPPTEVPPEETRPRGVTLRAMLACQGIVAQWMSVGGTLPPPVTETGTLPAPCGSIELVDAAAPSPPREPESPPPIAA